MDIYQHTDRFRQQIGSLDLMVSLYNKLQRTTLPVEWPLVASKLEAVGECAGRLTGWLALNESACAHPSALLRAEAALHRGLEGLVWKDDGTDAYIRDTLELVRDLDSVLTTIKDNVAHIQELLKTFEQNLMFDRKVGAALVTRRWVLCWAQHLFGGVCLMGPADNNVLCYAVLCLCCRRARSTAMRSCQTAAPRCFHSGTVRSGTSARRLASCCPAAIAS